MHIGLVHREDTVVQYLCILPIRTAQHGAVSGEENTQVITVSLRWTGERTVQQHYRILTL